MRFSSAALRLSFFISVLVAFVVGCSGGASTPGAYTKDTGPPEAGMVWNDAGEYWEYPASGGGSGDGYGRDAYDAQASSGSGSSDDADTSDDGYGNSDPYATSGNHDPYATGVDSDPYAATSGNSDPYATEGNSDPYATEGSSDPYASSNRTEDRDAANDGYGDDAYAAADGGYGQPAAAGGGGGTGVFAEEIEPILRAHCYNCHGGGPRGSKGDLQLHTVDAISSAGIIKAREPDESEIYIRISMDPGDKGRMPPKGPGLSKEELAKVENWIRSGASFGADSGANGGYGGGYGGAYASSNPAPRDGGYGDDAYDDDRGERNAPSPPKNLAEAASVSFSRGHDWQAMNQLFAQSLVKSPVGESVLAKYKWVPALRRSKLAVRWGIGIKYDPKDGYAGSPRPAGVIQDLPGEEDDRSSEGEEIVETSFQNGTLDYYTGDIGDELIFRLQSRIDRGYYGDILKEELTKALAGGDDEFDDAYDTGAGYGGGYGRSGGGGGSGGSTEKPDGELIKQIMPGVVMVGEASQSELFERAMRQGVDLLLVFDITSVGNRRTRIVNTSTRARLYDVVTKEQIALTGPIKNVDLQRARSEDPDDETIIKEMDKIFTVVDESKPYKAREFPTVTSDKAKASVIALVKDLIGQEAENPLWKLSEIRFYHSRGLLTDAHLASAFKRIAPERTAKLTNIVSDDEVQSLLADWLVSDEADENHVDDEDATEDDRSGRQKPAFR